MTIPQIPRLGRFGVIHRRPGGVPRFIAAALLVVGLVLLAVGLGTASAPAARADTEDEWRITAYHLTAFPQSDGEVVVELDLSFDFGSEPGHGPYLTFLRQQEIANDPDHYRVLEYSGFTASSSTGAPSDVQVDAGDRQVELRVGDADVEVSGSHDYTIGFTITGLLNPGVGGSDELYWNVIGSGFEVPISHALVEVYTQEPAQAVECFVGSGGSDQNCEVDDSRAQVASFAAADLEPGEGLTVVAAYPLGTFLQAEVLLEPRRTWGNTFDGSLLNWLITGVATAAGAFGLGRLARRSRTSQDSSPASLARTVGYTPRIPGIELHAPGWAQPPAGVSPALLGTLIDGKVQNREISAIIVDLAVRGHLRIEWVGDEGDDGRWLLHPGEVDPAVLNGVDAEIFQSIFGSDPKPQYADDLPEAFQKTYAKVTKDLYAEATERGWFVDNPSVARTRWVITGLLLLLGAIVAGFILAFTIGYAVFALVGVILGIVVMVVGWQIATRTAEGERLAAQAESFKAYLQGQLDTANDRNSDDRSFADDRLFSEFLPYAVALGVAEDWAQNFSAHFQGQAQDPSWVQGYDAGATAVWWVVVAGQMNNFNSATQTSAWGGIEATSGSSGGSGFSGGSVGGGVGGGGGGGW